MKQGAQNKPISLLTEIQEDMIISQAVKQKKLTHFQMRVWWLYHWGDERLDHYGWQRIATKLKCRYKTVTKAYFEAHRVMKPLIGQEIERLRLIAEILSVLPVAAVQCSENSPLTFTIAAYPDTAKDDRFIDSTPKAAFEGNKF